MPPRAVRPCTMPQERTRKSCQSTFARSGIGISRQTGKCKIQLRIEPFSLVYGEWDNTKVITFGHGIPSVLAR
jgi:hypothetical protein